MTPGSLSASLTRMWGLWEVTPAASRCSSRPVAMLREPLSPAKASTTSARWPAGSPTLQAIPGISSVHRTRTIRTINRTLPLRSQARQRHDRRRHEDARDDAGVRAADARIECAPNPVGANEVSRPGELHARPLSEPYVTVSRHTAPIA